MLEQTNPSDNSSADTRVFPLESARINLRVPARLDCLPVLCATVREFCATIPGLLNANDSSQNRSATINTPGTPSYSNFVYSIELVLQEAASNIVRHGYQESGKGFLELAVSLPEVEDLAGDKRRAIVMELTDNALPFDPTARKVDVPDPLNIAESGYGLYLIRKLTDQLEYSRRGTLNNLKMVKYVH
jgi:serine/threonine-protein kinase RsbW